MTTTTPASALERCGFCGMWFVGNTYLTVEELNQTDKAVLDAAPLSYCPNAGYEDPQGTEQRRVTRDMAIDAGDPTLEGQLL